MHSDAVYRAVGILSVHPGLQLWCRVHAGRPIEPARFVGEARRELSRRACVTTLTMLQLITAKLVREVGRDGSGCARFVLAPAPEPAERGSVLDVCNRVQAQLSDTVWLREGTIAQVLTDLSEHQVYTALKLLESRGIAERQRNKYRLARPAPAGVRQ